MRSTLFLLLVVCACKDGSETKPSEATPVATTEAKLEEALPSDFPLPSPNKLARSHKKLTMVIWEYELPGLAFADAPRTLEDGLRAAGWALASATFGDTSRRLTATHGGRLYVLTLTAQSTGSRLAIHSFPEEGPMTLNAPTSYPTTFPFLAGGTASHAPDGAKLTIAYQSDARDIELAMLLAAQTAGWQCSGAGSVTCTKDKANVTFTTEPAPGGSLLVVTAR